VTHSTRYEHSDGTPRELEARVVPERDGRGEITSVLALTRDVTPLKQQEREAQQRAVLAEQLIGIVSHDLRNPLNAILLGAQLLGQVELGPHARVVRPHRHGSAAPHVSKPERLASYPGNLVRKQDGWCLVSWEVVLGGRRDSVRVGVRSDAPA